MIKVLFFGDIVGRPGRHAVSRFIEENRKAKKYDLVVANADNLSSGRGPTLKSYEEMVAAGVDVLTCGDHIWDQKEAQEILNLPDSKLIRPMNYPQGVPGKGSIDIEVKGKKFTIISLLGRVFTTEGLDNPFTMIEEFLTHHKTENIIIDLHAEATSEKVAFGTNLAGRVTGVLGTHTHVQTADEKIVDGTAMITDVGSCSPYNSVIGVDPKNSIKRFKTGMPLKFEVAEGPVQINAVELQIDEKTGKCENIERIFKLYD